jgi:solute carrier family 25 iron transporter 28/37
MEHVAMYPVDTVKTNMQAVAAEPGAAPMGVREAIVNIHRSQGLAGFVRGCTAIGVGCIPAHVGLFGTYELSKYWLLKPGAEKEHAPLRAACCGALSTMVHDSIIVPLDVVKQRLQLGCYSNTMDCVKRTYASEGMMAFYRSLPSTLIMECPFYAILVAANESLKLALKIEGSSRISERNVPSWYFMSAGISGIIASALTQPLDVIKTRLQTQEVLRDLAKNSDGASGVRYRGLVMTFSSVLREEGVRGLYRGTLPRMVFAAPSAAMCWGTYEAVKTMLNWNG